MDLRIGSRFDIHFYLVWDGSVSRSMAAGDWVPEGKVMVYQPQLESFKGDKVTGRAAISLQKVG